MSEWQHVIGNSNLIQYETGTSYLIKLPKSDYKVWISKKLVTLSGKGGYRMRIGYLPHFTFKIFKNGKGRYNSREIIDEREITAKQFAEYFGDQDG